MADHPHKTNPVGSPTGSRKQSVQAFSAEPGAFEILVKGQLDSTWSNWLEGLDVKLLENGEMLLTGNIVDRAALMSILNRLYSLNLTLLSVTKIDVPDKKE